MENGKLFSLQDGSARFGNGDAKRRIFIEVRGVEKKANERLPIIISFWVIKRNYYTIMYARKIRIR